jgi:hypothetical protein
VQKRKRLKNRLAFRLPCFNLIMIRVEKKERKAPNKMISRAMLLKAFMDR